MRPHAVVVDRIDDGKRNRTIPFRGGREIELPLQVGLQGLLGAVTGVEVEVGVGRRAARGQRRIDVLPAAIDRKFLWDLVLPFSIGGPDLVFIGVGIDHHLGGGFGVVLALEIDLVETHIDVGSVARVFFGLGWRLSGAVHQLVCGFFRFRVVVVVLHELQHWIGLDRLLNSRFELERGVLQQADRLLKLRRHGELMTLTDDQLLLHRVMILRPLGPAQQY